MEVKERDYLELERQRDISSVLLLREMDQAEDLRLRRELFNQAADQEASHISEVLEGTVKTNFEFTVSEGRLYLLQPNGVTDWLEMHVKGVKRARARANADPRFAPYVQIAEAELAEARDQENMIKSGKPVAMGKLSLCGNDVMSDAVLEQIGRDTQQQRAYFRFSVYDGKSLHIHSRSIDGVNLRDGARGISSGWGAWSEQVHLGSDASSIDVLKSVAKFEGISLEEMHSLADKAVDAYDKLLKQRTGQEYRGGRCPEGVDTYKFIMDNYDLFQVHMDSLKKLSCKDFKDEVAAALSNELRYDIMSSFKRRLEGSWIDKASLAESVSFAGSSERSAGTQYYGCDTVVGQSNNAETAGYVNGHSTEVKTKCVKCPNKKCGKIVDLPDKLLKENIMHCTQCKLSVHTKGGRIDQKIIDKFYGKQTHTKKTVDGFSRILADLAKYENQRKQKETLAKIKQQRLAESA